MSEYAERFAESDIDIDVLSELTIMTLIDLACRSVIAGKCCEQSENLALRQSRLRRSVKHLRRPFQTRPQGTLPSAVR